MSAEEVAEVWGCSAWTVYQQAKAGTLPVAPLRLGRLLRWPAAAVYASVGLRSDSTPCAAPTDGVCVVVGAEDVESNERPC